MVDEASTDSGVYIQVVELGGDREISRGGIAAESLRKRIGDIRAGIHAAAESVVESLDDLAVTAAWELDEVSATFGITLTAEAGVILSKASTQATFEVTITYRRTDATH